MASRRINVAVTSVGSGIGQAIVDGCRRSSLPIEVLGLDMRPLSYGAVECDRFAPLPPVSHPEYLSSLLDECASNNIEALVPGLDSELLLLAQGRGAFESKGIKLIVAGADLIALCRDKLRWGRELSAPSGIVLPCFTPHEAMERLGSAQLALPLIAKPLDGSASMGVQILHSAGQLAGIGPGYIVQPFVLPARTDEAYGEIKAAADEGRLVQAAEISVQSLYGKDGRLLGRMASRNRLKNGVPIEVVPVELGPDAAAIDALESRLRPLGLCGTLNLQGRMTEKGLRLFEMNPRFTGISGLRARLGFNEVEAAIRDALDLPQVDGPLVVNPRKIGVRQVADRVIDPTRSNHFSAMVARRGSSGVAGQCVLVTGSTGWLARQLVARLADDPRVATLTLLSRNPDQLRSQLPKTDKAISVVQQPASDQRPALLAGKFDLVYHLASGRPVDTLESQADSLRATAALFEHLADNGLGSLVNVSSQSVYGLKRPPPWSEDLPPAPETPYAMMKLASEILAQSIGKISPASRVTSIRLARLYGAAPGLRWTELPHLFAQKAVVGTAITIKGGNQQFDLIHINDTIAALLALLDDQKDWQDIYNIGGNSPFGIFEIASAAVDAARSLGLPGSEIETEIGADASKFGMDCSRFRRDFGWAPKIGLSQAMHELVKMAAERPAE